MRSPLVRRPPQRGQRRGERRGPPLLLLFESEGPTGHHCGAVEVVLAQPGGQSSSRARRESLDQSRLGRSQGLRSCHGPQIGVFRLAEQAGAYR